jgi:SAM-dependent methyltransferase
MQTTANRQIRERDDPAYVMGRSQAETARLQEQAQLYDPSTRRMLEAAGIRAGMNVLDLGSGAGDVALLAASMVGATGCVVGIDSNAAVLDMARRRAQTAGLTQLRFIAADIRDAELDDDFDAIIGRLVLVYLKDAAALLAKLARHLRQGGSFAFQEIDWNVGPTCSPASPTLTKIWTWASAVFLRSGLDARMGSSLRRVFMAAGLPAPRMHLDAPVGGGPGFAGFDYLEKSVRSGLPSVIALGVAAADEVDVNTIARRLRAELGDSGVFALPAMVSAWTRKS